MTQPVDAGAAALLARLRAFLFPGGEDAARSVRAIRMKEEGEIRASAEARWIPFTAEEEIHATSSGFCWIARMKGSRLGSVQVTDAYEEGHGRLVVKLGGLIPVRKMTGPDVDRGELQRYLASLSACPPILLRHGSLEWSAIGPATLRVRDREDPTGAAVDLEIGEDGRPVAGRAERPRTVGSRAILTPWRATGTEYREFEGMWIAAGLEASWELPEGAFFYYRAQVSSFELVR